MMLLPYYTRYNGFSNIILVKKDVYKRQVKGTSFSGCVNYVLKEDKSRLLKAVGVYGSPEEIAEQFELQTLLNDKVKNKVGHISLSFSAEDGDRIRDDDGLMLKIAHDYMKLMGIENKMCIRDRGYLLSA